MEVNRAIQILGSDQQFDVTYEGESIWIDDINPDAGTASIHSVGTGRTMNVRVDRLHEPQGYQ